MALSFGRSKSDDVVSLIAAKKYGPAIEILREQLKKRGASTTVRKQLADVLVLSGKTVEAVSLLLPLADKFAREGFAAKAVSVLKKIQKIDPGRRDVEERLARLIEEKQRQAAVALPTSRPGLEIGMEEIGMEAPPSGPIDIPVAPPPAPDPVVIPAPGPAVAAPPPEPLAADTPAAKPAPVTPEPILAPPPEPVPLEISPAQVPLLTDAGPDATLPLPTPDPPPGAGGTLDLEGPLLPVGEILDLEGTPAPAGATLDLEGSPTPAEADEPVDEIEDYDLLYVPDGEEAEEDAEEEIVLPDATPDEAMSEGGFADELMSLVDSVFQESPDTAPDAAGTPAPEEPAPGGGQIVVSPLFRDFSVDEMVAVIQGLKLLTFERGQVILREGKPGGSLYMLTAGRVRAFRKDRQTGKQAQIGDLEEGAFFGEMSILTGQPRMASIVALNSCELLELDRPTLDGITKTHPHVWDVLREFAEQRSQARG